MIRNADVRRFCGLPESLRAREKRKAPTPWQVTSRTRGLGAISLLLALAAVGAGHAQVRSRGTEFQLNSYTTGEQTWSGVCADAGGNFVVTWQSSGSYGSDQDSSIQVRRFAADGTPLGTDLQVNTFTTDVQWKPVIACAPSGRFVVAWESWASSGPDTDGRSIQAQRFHADATPDGPQFEVNTYTTGTQWNPDVAMGATGDFVVVWESAGSAGTDSDLSSIQWQRYATDGTPVGGELQVNAYTTGLQGNPAVATDPAGNLVIVWNSAGSGGNDDSSFSVQARLFDSSGAPIGNDFQVNSYTTGIQARPDVAVDAMGKFVVSWSSYGSNGTDTSLTSIQAQRFFADGSPSGAEFQVNTYTSGYQFVPTVAADPAGSFVVSWESNGSFGTDTSDFSVQARRFDSEGNPWGAEFQVNTSTSGYQVAASLVQFDGGRFVVVWDSDSPSGSDLEPRSIEAQFFETAFFFDGFESGDASGWSLVVP